MLKKKSDVYSSPDYEDVIKKTNEPEFVIGQVYEETPARKIICKICGSKEWIVGVGDYFTAIKCPNCKYEKCIHEG